jgi:hypothetical protein
MLAPNTEYRIKQKDDSPLFAGTQQTIQEIGLGRHRTFLPG